MQVLALTLLLWFHLLCVSVASAGPLVAMWFDWREGRGSGIAGRVGRSLTWMSLVLLVLGAGLGLLVGALLWDDAYQATLHRFQRKINFGIWELLFSLVLLTISAVWWALRTRSSRVGRGLRMLLQLMAGTNLLYHFPSLFIVISQAAPSHDASAVIDAAEFRRLAFDSSAVSRTIHFWLAALAVTGVVVMAFGESLRQRSDEGSARVTKWGARIALLPVVLQLPVGVWLVSQLSPTEQRIVLGGDLPAALLLLSSITLTLWLMHLLSAAALGDTTHRSTRRCILLTLLIVGLMTAVLVRVRG